MRSVRSWLKCKYVGATVRTLRLHAIVENDTAYLAMSWRRQAGPASSVPETLGRSILVLETRWRRPTTTMRRPAATGNVQHRTYHRSSRVPAHIAVQWVSTRVLSCFPWGGRALRGSCRWSVGQPSVFSRDLVVPRGRRRARRSRNTPTAPLHPTLHLLHIHYSLGAEGLHLVTDILPAFFIVPAISFAITSTIFTLLALSTVHPENASRPLQFYVLEPTGTHFFCLGFLISNKASFNQYVLGN